MKTKEYLKADMWCHFGTTIIRGLDEGSMYNTRMQETRKYWKHCFRAKVEMPQQLVQQC